MPGTAPRQAPSLGAVALLAVIASGCQDRAAIAPTIGLAGLDSLAAAADRLYWAGETDSAGALYAVALDQARDGANPAGEARALSGLGRVAYRRNDYQRARQLGQDALDFKLRRGLHDQLFESHNLLGLIALQEGRYAEAITQHGTARELALAAADTANLAKVWTNLALSHIEMGELGEARQLLTLALPAARGSGQGVIEGRVLTNLGMLAVRTGSPDSAVPLLEEGLAILRRVEDVIGEQNNLGQLGTAYAALGELGRAIAYLDSAVAQARRTESPQEEASDLEQLAALHREAGEFPRSLDLLERARVINHGLGLVEETGLNLRNTAEIHLELDNPALARRMADSALATHRGAGARLAEFGDRLVLARIAAALGDRSGSSDHLGAARTLAAAAESPLFRARVVLAEARIADGNGDASAVLRTLGDARTDLRFAGQDRDWEVPWLASRALARFGSLDSAAALGRRAVEAVERIRADLGSGWLRTSYLAERSAVYHDLVDILLRLGRRAEALEVADGARGRVLLDRLAAVRTNSAPSARELAEGERQLLGQIERVTRRIEGIEGRGDGDLSNRYRAELDRLYTGLERTRAEFGAALIRSEEREPGRLGLLGGRPEAARLQAALRSDEALLEYLIGPDRSHLFVVTRDSVVPVALPVRSAEIEARVRVTRELLARRTDQAAVDPALTALHGLLLDAARATPALANVRRLIVVPHGPLAHLPFAALRNGATGRYLIEDYTVMSLPAAGVLPALRGRRPIGPPAAGTAAFAPFDTELPGTVAEARALAAAVVGSRVVIGRQATEAAVRRSLGERRIVHLATHGVLNARNPLFSRLELAGAGRGRRTDPANDGRLEVYEVDRTSIGAVLVFLSGCETGVGGGAMTGQARGEDHPTLARAFLHAGAANVIATLWRIEDAGAAAFASAFYRELARAPGEAHGNVTDGLAFAQREMLRQPRYRSPFYWAGYLLSGSGDLGPAGSQTLAQLSVLHQSRSVGGSSLPFPLTRGQP